MTSAARIALIGIKEEDVDAIWADLGMNVGNVVGICVRSVKACPGTTYCKRGQQDSLAVGLELDQKYHGMEMPGKMKIGVSGCPNQCAETSFKDIELVGIPKGWRVYVGGNGGANPRIGETLAQRIDTEHVLALVEKIIDYYRANAKPRERMGKMIERLGLEDMEESLGLGSRCDLKLNRATVTAGIWSTGRQIVPCKELNLEKLAILRHPAATLWLARPTITRS